MFNLNALQKEVAQINLVAVIYHKANHSDCCIYCARKFNEKKKGSSRTRDHLVAQAKLKHASLAFKEMFYRNLIVHACRHCNDMKKDKSLLEFCRFIAASKMPNKSVILKTIRQSGLCYPLQAAA
jgi:hypothetical protein